MDLLEPAAVFGSAFWNAEFKRDRPRLTPVIRLLFGRSSAKRRRRNYSRGKVSDGRIQDLVDCWNLFPTPVLFAASLFSIINGGATQREKI